MHGTVFTIEDRCDGTAASVDEGSVELIPNNRARGVTVRPGSFAITYCADPTTAAPYRTCTLILRSTDPTEKDFFSPQIGTSATVDGYVLCLTPPRGSQRCQPYPFDAPTAEGVRASDVWCFTSGAGAYRASWRIGGRRVGPPLHFRLPPPRVALPNFGGRCYDDLASTGPEQPYWRYGPPVVRAGPTPRRTLR